MEFLLKLMQITKNVIKSLHVIHKKAQCELITEQLLKCGNYQIETITVKMNKQKIDQQTQTEQQNHEPVRKKVLIRKDKKQFKLQTQLQRSIDWSQQSEVTEQSQNSSCQNHILHVLQRNEADNLLEQSKPHKAAKRKTAKQTSAILAKKLLNLSNNDEKHLKSTRSASEECENNLEENQVIS